MGRLSVTHALALRRLAQLYAAYRANDAAIEVWFLLAAQLFHCDSEKEMRAAIREVLALDPKNRRAYRLLSLLEQR